MLISSSYSEFGDPKPSLTTLLKDEISSVAYSYTAGAKYKGKGIFGQLVYGGYDASRYMLYFTFITAMPGAL